MPFWEGIASLGNVQSSPIFAPTLLSGTLITSVVDIVATIKGTETAERIAHSHDQAPTGTFFPAPSCSGQKPNS